jgi:RimJ/RimL family protein N-acetyltransferase
VAAVLRKKLRPCNGGGVTLPLPLAWQLHVAGRAIGLADGRRAVFRTLDAGEVGVVQDVFDGMGDESRRQRFAGLKRALTRRDLELLTAVDHERHEAVVAIDAATGRAVGEAHLVRDDGDRQLAEIAFSVVDAWQGRRVGTYLAAGIAARARQLGIRRLRASMLSDNVRSRALMRRLGRVVATRYDRGAVEVEVALE